MTKDVRFVEIDDFCLTLFCHSTAIRDAPATINHTDEFTIIVLQSRKTTTFIILSSVEECRRGRRFAPSALETKINFII